MPNGNDNINVIFFLIIFFYCAIESIFILIMKNFLSELKFKNFLFFNLKK